MMKKIVVILIGWFCLNSAYAQWSVTSEVGMAGVKSTKSDGWSTRIKAGVGLEYDFSKRFALKSGLYYANRGYSHSSILPIYSDEENKAVPAFTNIKPNYGYLQLPIMAKLGWQVADEVRFNIAVGPYLAYRLHAGGKYDIYSNYYSQEQSNEYSYGGYGYYSQSIPGINSGYKFDWGASLAVGMEVKNWIMSIGYDLDLGKKFSGDKIETKYRTISLAFGYKFRL